VAGTGVVCGDLKELVRVWGKGSSFVLPLDMGGVGSELSFGIESLELPGSVLVGQEGVPWGLGVLGRLVTIHPKFRFTPYPKHPQDPSYLPHQPHKPLRIYPNQ